MNDPSLRYIRTTSQTLSNVTFFAGIGGWSYALRLAQWPDNEPVWTASLPCQPFSTAGKGLGKDDERHLLPHFLELVKKCRPNVLFGEQVERAIGHGWLDDLQATMEAEGYAVGHCVLGAHSVNAAHIRQRLYWVADYYGERLEGRERTECTDKLIIEQNSLVDWEADSQSSGFKASSKECGEKSSEWETNASSSRCGINRVGISNNTGSQQGIETNETARHRGSLESAGDANRMGNTEYNGRITSQIKGSNESAVQRGEAGKNCTSESEGASSPSSISWIYCRDDKYRPIESGLKPLVDGVPRGMVHGSDPRNTQEARVMRLKGYGNAIVPQLAAEFIKAWKLSTTQSVIRTIGY